MEVIRRGNLSLVRFTNTIYSSNTYLIHSEGSEDAWLIDCGDTEPILTYLFQRSLNLRGVFLTHVHYDHIYGLPILSQRISTCTVYTSETGVINLRDPKYNFSKYHGASFSYPTDGVHVLKDQEKIDLLNGYELQSYSTPGHDWSCLTFRIDDFLFTGDAFIPGIKTVTTFPKSNKKQAEDSLNVINKLISEQTIICPGHGTLFESINKSSI